MSDNELGNVDPREVAELFAIIQQVTDGKSLATVACALCATLAACILEAQEPGDDLEEGTRMALSEMERTVRDVISGTGPIKLVKGDVN